MRIRLSFALLLVCPLAVGCGEVIADQQPDADPGAIDAEIVPDAEVIDADLTATATATAHAHFAGTGTTGAAIEGIVFVSARPDGSIADTATSDATGAVSLDIWPGGSVTAIYPHTAVGDIGHELVTYFGVQPGDALDFGTNQASGTGTAIGSLTMSWPTYSGIYYGDANSGQNSAGAYAPTLSASMNFSDYIPSPVDVFYRGYNSSFVPQKWNYRPDITVPGGSGASSFWNDYTTGTLSLSGVSPLVTYISMNLGVICNQSYFCDNQGISGNPTGGAYTGTFPRAQTGDRAFGSLNLSRDGNFQGQRFIEAMPSNASQWTVTNPPAMPWVVGNITASGRAREGSFYALGDGAYDGLAARFQWYHYDPITSTNYYSNWYMLMPPRAPGLTTLKLPDLGADNEAVLPQPNDTMYLGVMLIDIQDAAVADYDDLRQLPERTVFSPDLAVRLGTFTRVHTSGSSGL